MNTPPDIANLVLGSDDLPPSRSREPPQLLDLPDDILLSLLLRYCSRRDTARFARIEKRSVHLARSVLYTRLVVPSLRTFPGLLHTLRSCSDIAHSVHELALASSAVDAIQALGFHHGLSGAELSSATSSPSLTCLSSHRSNSCDGTSSWPLKSWICAFVEAVPSAWHLDLSQVALPVLTTLFPVEFIAQQLLPLLSSRNMTLSLPRYVSLLHGSTSNVSAGTAVALDRVDFAHCRCNAVVSLGGHGSVGGTRTSSPTSPSNDSMWQRDRPTMRLEGASWPTGRDGDVCQLLEVQECGAQLSPPPINLQHITIQSATKATVYATDPADINLAIQLAPRALIAELTLTGVDQTCVNQMTKLVSGSQLASLSSLTLASISAPITPLLASAATHLPLLNSLTLINLNVPFESTLVAVDYLVRRPRPLRPLRKLKIVGVFDYLPSESTTHCPIAPQPFSLADSTVGPALTHLILNRKSPFSNALHQSQTSRVRPRILLSPLLVPTLRVLSIHELDVVIPRSIDPAAPFISLLHPNIRGPLAPFYLLTDAAFPNLRALRVDVQNADLQGNMLPRAAPRLECLVAQNLAGDFSRAVAVVDLLAAYPQLTHVWLDKNLWLPIAQVQKLGQVLFSPRPPPPPLGGGGGGGARAASASPNGSGSRKRSPVPGAGPRSRLMRDTLPHLDRIVVDNAHAQCLVGGALSLPLELPSPPSPPISRSTSECAEVQACAAGLRMPSPGGNGHHHHHSYPGSGFVDDLSQEPHGFRPVPLDTAIRYREWMEQVYQLM